jgi:hypothetical protein
MPRHERKPCSGCGFAFMIAANSAIVAGPSLRKTGVEVVVGKATDRARTRIIDLRKIEQAENQQQPPSRQRQAAGGADGSDGNRAVAKVIQFRED